MFVPKEVEYLTETLRKEIQALLAMGKGTATPRGILDKLEHLDEYGIELHCYLCLDDQEPEAFAKGYRCIRCGRRICDWCYEHLSALCDECERTPPDPTEAAYEAADVLRDWAMDR